MNSRWRWKSEFKIEKLKIVYMFLICSHQRARFEIIIETTVASNRRSYKDRLARKEVSSNENSGMKKNKKNFFLRFDKLWILLNNQA